MREGEHGAEERGGREREGERERERKRERIPAIDAPSPLSVPGLSQRGAASLAARGSVARGSVAPRRPAPRSAPPSTGNHPEASRGDRAGDVRGDQDRGRAAAVGDAAGRLDGARPEDSDEAGQEGKEGSGEGGSGRGGTRAAYGEPVGSKIGRAHV